MAEEAEVRPERVATPPVTLLGALEASPLTRAWRAVVIFVAVGFVGTAHGEAAPVWLVVLAVGAGLVVVLLAAQRVLRPSTKRVELLADPDRVVIEDDRRTRVVFLSDVRAVREEADGSLRLQRGPAPRRDDPLLPPAEGLRATRLREALARSVRPGGPPPPRLLLTLPRSGHLASCALAVLSAVLLGVVLLSARVEALDLLRPLLERLEGSPGWLLLLPGAWLAVWSLERLTGHARLLDDRLEARSGGDAVAWGDVVGWHPIGGLVRLVLRPGLLRPRAWLLPGPPPLRDLLRARGVPEVTPGQRPRRAGERPTLPPVARLRGWRLGRRFDLPALAAVACVSAPFVGVVVWRELLERAGLSAPAGLVPLGVVGGAVLAVVVQHRLRQAATDTDVFPDRVCLRGTSRARTVFFADLEAFDDDSSDVVRLIQRRTGHRHGLAARDEADRMALLAALEAAGVPRHGGSPRAPRREDPPLLEVAARFGPLRLNHAILHADRIVSGLRVLAWDDVLGFVDEGDRLLLQLRPGASGDLEPDVHLPTPTALDRLAVTRLLRERGVPELA